MINECFLQLEGCFENKGCLFASLIHYMFILRFLLTFSTILLVK